MILVPDAKFCGKLFLVYEELPYAGNSFTLPVGVDLIRTVTIYIDEKDIDAMAKLVRKGKYPNRSEFVRSAIRELIDRHQPS
ncbi:MAG: ribbon-helix-helix domain-containing protein [Candidatus Heimdallarchaeota archaeon]